MDRAYTTNDYGYARAQEEYDRQEPPEPSLSQDYGGAEDMGHE